MRWRSLLRELTPPALARAMRDVRNRRLSLPEWEYVPEGWAYAESHPGVKGWDVPDIVEVYKRKWSRFAQYVESTGPLGVSHVSALCTNENTSSHNLLMTYAYVLALAARHKDRLGLLDWGGGIGHYYLLARAILPEVEVDYHCRDLPHMCRYGEQLFPGQKFLADDRWMGSTYDLVMASGSLQCIEDWQKLLSDLCVVTGDFLYITDLPIVRQSPPFVFVQRCYHYGYNTEYLGWCFNERELLHAVEAGGLVLRREFVFDYKPVIRGAPEQSVFRGYLFQRPTRHDRVSRLP